jgi:hypothetical protein
MNFVLLDLCSHRSCSAEQQAYIRKIVDEKRLEFLAGGWVMTDEAAVSLYSMVDQFIEGSSANSPLRRD